MKIFLLALIIVCFHIIPAQFQSCGRTQFSSGLIVNGEEVKRGEFPFVVALFMLKSQKFFCGANLITQKHAVSGSNCFLKKSQFDQLYPEDVIAQLGRFNLKNHIEKGAINKEISEIILHEDWKSYATRYDADISILVFNSEVQLSEYIRTVCLPTSSQAYDLIEGEVVGYGVSERTDFREPEETPKKSKMNKPPSNENCFLQNSLLTSIASNRTFCAEGDNSGPCFGDSGGGLYVQRNSVWYLQGIVSSLLINKERRCDVSTYAVFTNVALYVDWIWEKVDGLRKTELQCDFSVAHNLKTLPYSCDVKIQITTDDVSFTSVTGNYYQGTNISNIIKRLNLNPHNNGDEKCNIEFIPSGISDMIPNLRIFYLQNCKLKTLSRKNFKGFNELSTLSLTDNWIERIDEDTFHEVPKLISLRLNSNRLTTIQSDLFINSPHLEYFNCTSNQISELLGDQLFRNNPELRSIDFENNKLEKIKMKLSDFDNLIKVNFLSNKCINNVAGYNENTQTMSALQKIINISC